MNRNDFNLLITLYFIFQETIDDLALYFYIACGIAGLLFFILFILVIMLFYKINQLVNIE